MKPKSVWAEIDLSAISHNVRQLKSILNPGCRLMAVVKANAYGHGMLEVSRQAIKDGAEVLGVARISEAVRIREAYIDAPVLIFGYTSPEYAEELVAYDLIQTVYSYEAAKRLSDIAAARGKKIKAHVKVDTGMGRLGILPCDLRLPEGRGIISENALHEVELMKRLPGIELEGIYTHFAAADCQDKIYSRQQFDLFNNFIDALKMRGIEFGVKHTANSAAIIDMPETQMDMVRAGISIYGIYPSDAVNKAKVSLKPAMTLKTRVIHVKRVNAGFKVSYGATAEIKQPTVIATVGIGYADGYNRLLSSKGRMLIHGYSAQVIGRVCMDQTMIDVGHVPDVALGDEVVVFGSQADAGISVDEISNNINTISYEVVTSVSDRVKRIYLT